LTLQNGSSIAPAHNQVVLQTNASKKGRGAFFQGIRTWGAWSREEENFHINVLELLAIKYAILSICQERKVKSLHIQVDNKVALSYLLKMGGTTSICMTKYQKKFGDSCFKT